MPSCLSRLHVHFAFFLQANIAYWEKSLKDSEENIRDMLQRKR